MTSSHFTELLEDMEVEMLAFGALPNTSSVGHLS
jgi:hypothetical protein